MQTARPLKEPVPRQMPTLNIGPGWDKRINYVFESCNPSI